MFMFVLPVIVIEYLYQNVPYGQHQRKGHKVVVHLEYFRYMIHSYYSDITLMSNLGHPEDDSQMCAHPHG